MVMASDTPTVLNCHAIIFSLSRAFLTMRPRSRTEICEPSIHDDLIKCVTYDECCFIFVSTLEFSNVGEKKTHLQGLPSHQTVATPI